MIATQIGTQLKRQLQWQSQRPTYLPFCNRLRSGLREIATIRHSPSIRTSNNLIRCRFDILVNANSLNCMSSLLLLSPSLLLLYVLFLFSFRFVLFDFRFLFLELIEHIPFYFSSHLTDKQSRKFFAWIIFVCCNNNNSNINNKYQQKSKQNSSTKRLLQNTAPLFYNDDMDDYGPRYLFEMFADMLPPRKIQNFALVLWRKC